MQKKEEDPSSLRAPYARESPIWEHSGEKERGKGGNSSEKEKTTFPKSI